MSSRANSQTESSPLLPSALLPSDVVTLPSDPANGSDFTQFPPSSPLNPRNWSRWRKWLLIAAITPIDLSISWGASGFSPAEGKFAEDFGISDEVARLGLSLYILGVGLGPMFLAPLSELLGRSGIYTGSYAIFLIFLAGTAVAPCVSVFMVLRFFSGLFAAVTVANFGGTIADLYPQAKTGRAMSIYLWAATCGSPSGFFLLSAVAQTHGWRTVFWALLGINGGLWLILVAALWGNETRHTTILRREAKRVAENQRWRHGAGMTIPASPKRRSPKEILHVALTRPFRFLFTEAIVMFGALYNGFLYGLSFLFNVVFVQVFGVNHGFTTFGVGCAFLGIVAGISLGPLTNLWQERYYQRAISGVPGGNVPEARVQLAKVAALVFPISMFWFAWTTDTAVQPLAPIVASAFWGWSFYTLILMTFQYTEDAYRVFSASALAGISLVRNIAGAAFPMFGKQLFERLGYQWGASLVASIAIILAPIPFVLERYGVELRKRSPWARQHMNELEEEEDDDHGV
ncbi:hypothetical protein DL764_001355 [Monosporascus ibericus]|uniref:Major facilitator superfamily (MFS) profile domain-containing protein n=1 Tax=Monosporascus ibericus TaxID=155417 RepID=A0A4Q4TRG8_9PEZI|nr:hypothetical protein DL764_001355 [Monosporascus ibericus]